MTCRKFSNTLVLDVEWPNFSARSFLEFLSNTNEQFIKMSIDRVSVSNLLCGSTYI